MPASGATALSVKARISVTGPCSPRVRCHSVLASSRSTAMAPSQRRPCTTNASTRRDTLGVEPLQPQLADAEQGLDAQLLGGLLVRAPGGGGGSAGGCRLVAETDRMSCCTSSTEKGLRR